MLARLRRRRRFRFRPILALCAILVAAALVSGCGMLFVADPTLVQRGDAGDLRFRIELCGDASIPGPGSVCTSGSAAGDTRVLNYALVPTASAPPTRASITINPAALVNHGGVTNISATAATARNAALEQTVEASDPAPAGSMWVAYVSDTVNFDISTSYQTVSNLDVPIRGADGAAPSSAAWAVIGAAAAPTNASADPATDVPTPTLGIVRFPATGTNTLALRTLVVTPTTPAIAIAARTTGTVGFGLTLNGGALPGAGAVAISARTSIPGATATLASSSVVPSNGATTTIPVQLAIPASTPAGATGTVTLTTTTLSGEIRTAIANVTVPYVSAPPLPPLPPPAQRTSSRKAKPLRC